MHATDGRRAIVIGAGIGGLSAAIGLRGAGFDVKVYERMPELREVGSGLTLWVNAMRALEKLGVADAVREQGAVVQRIENRKWRGGPLKPLQIGDVGKKFGTASVGIHRGELQAALAKSLPEGVLHLGATCTGFAEDDAVVTVRIDDGREERAEVLVGADGIGSTIREQLFGKPEKRYSGYTCWRSATSLDHSQLETGVYTQLYGPGSNFGIFPIGGGWSWYGTNVTGAGEGAGNGAGWKAEATEQFQDWYEAVPAVIEATPEEAFVRQDIYDLEPVNEWARGRVTLLGDAAHATTPALGQGGCMAIEDAVVLKRVLSSGGELSTALSSYVEQRRKRANGIVRQARRHGAFYHAANPVVGALRDGFLKTAPTKIAMREVEKLMGYEA